MLQPVFFDTAGGDALFGVYRCPDASAPGRVWVLCPPFAEEDKSARRALTEICAALTAAGDATFLFSYRGTGDSAGEFRTATLTAWREDIVSAVGHARAMSGAASVGLLGVRLGASLALQVSAAVAADQLLLVEPLLSGRAFLMQQSLRRKMRGELTAGDETTPAPSPATSPTPPTTGDFEDLDGWPLGAALRAELNQLDLKQEAISAPPGSHIFQVGPRAEVAPALQFIAEKLGAPVHAVVMPAFWNLLDYASPAPLVGAVQNCLGSARAEVAPHG